MPPRLETTHLPHLMADDADAPAQVRRLAAHYGDLVRFASQVEPGHARKAPVPCRRRPGRRTCSGLIVVERPKSKPEVAWRCPDCKAGGVITGWQGTPADLRAMRRDPGRAVRKVPVTVEALAALRDVARENRDLGRLAFSAQVDARGRPVLFVADDEREDHQARLALAALQMAGERAADHLMAILGVLAGSPAGGGGARSIVELDASDIPDLLRMLLELPDSRPPEFVLHDGRRQRGRIRPLRRRSSPTFQIKVTLRDVRPPIWRRLLVPSDILLPQLHEVLQVAIGWTNSHLHLFRVGGACYAPPGDWEPVGADSRSVALVDLAAKQGSRLVYEYDFGDGWTHDIVVEAVLPEPCQAVRCTAGRRRCPPEDCGGPWGYQEFLAALADRSHERHEEIRDWCGDDFDPEEFDVDAVNAGLRRVVVG